MSVEKASRAKITCPDCNSDNVFDLFDSDNFNYDEWKSRFRKANIARTNADLSKRELLETWMNDSMEFSMKYKIHPNKVSKTLSKNNKGDFYSYDPIHRRSGEFEIFDSFDCMNCKFNLEYLFKMENDEANHQLHVAFPKCDYKLIKEKNKRVL